MTGPTIQDAEPGPYVPAGHPVRSFALALVAVALTAGALWWSGLLAPRLNVSRSWAGSFNTDSRVGDIQVSVHNAGPLPLRLERITVAGHGYRFAGAGLLVPDANTNTIDGHGLPPFEPTELAAGETAELQIRFEVDECLNDDPELGISVRTAVGLHRTIDLGDRDQMEIVCGTTTPG